MIFSWFRIYEKTSMTVSALRLWVEQKIAEGIIDKSLLADDSQAKKKHINRIGWGYPSRCDFRITFFTVPFVRTNHQGGARVDIIVRQFNVIGLRAEFPKCFTKNVYVYVDSKDQQSLRMLARKKLQGFRARAAYSLKSTKKYCLICCELNKREEPAFLEAMDELHRNLLIKGYRDYEACCDVVFSSIKQGA